MDKEYITLTDATAERFREIKGEIAEERGCTPSNPAVIRRMYEEMPDDL